VQIFATTGASVSDYTRTLAPAQSFQPLASNLNCRVLLTADYELHVMKGPGGNPLLASALVRGDPSGNIGPKTAQLRMPLPAGNWQLTTEAGSGPNGGRFWRGGFDPLHANRSKYALDFAPVALVNGTVVPQLRIAVLAAADGVVDHCVRNVTGTTSYPSYGNYCAINHGGFSTLYAHMLFGSIPATLTPGSFVHAGQQIGVMGNTGYSTGTHLHFEVRYLNDGATQPVALDHSYVDGIAIIDHRISDLGVPIFYASTNFQR
jgi:murein DD-endopeptidase MepM/ murein hydrolase activator NlpD